MSFAANISNLSDVAVAAVICGTFIWTVWFINHNISKGS